MISGDKATPRGISGKGRAINEAGRFVACNEQISPDPNDDRSKEIVMKAISHSSGIAPAGLPEQSTNLREWQTLGEAGSAVVLRAYRDAYVRAQTTLADGDWLAARDQFAEYLDALMVERIAKNPPPLSPANAEVEP